MKIASLERKLYFKNIVINAKFDLSWKLATLIARNIIKKTFTTITIRDWSKIFNNFKEFLENHSGSYRHFKNFTVVPEGPEVSMVL